MDETLGEVGEVI
jgi:hypothetical protein